ncbi:sporulation protein YunB [Anaerotignum sp.]|uniref:sporulation protein YunB n=1 Tax=Anaerotignum sp. TaxID=2039241 RepID=UPI002A90BA97|nr:sporulation protein YunB [Anaerotignum sp.]MCI7657648.1 sporulation protein YunB [Clostridia bacterium]MDY5415427.1 sporulation protein YunB [Anaerotignum sp.]
MGAKRRKRHSFSWATVLLIMTIGAAFGLGLRFFDIRLTEIATEMSKLESKTAANRVIDTALERTLTELSMEAEDFYFSNKSNPDGISADTIAINRFCTTLSREITEELEVLNNEKIKVPLGSISGVELFANWGPDIPFSMQPKGAAQVDYETKMESKGINQMHFQIWINISLEIRIVNPLHEESIPMTRKIMLVDTVFGGDVPEEYFQWETADLPIDRTIKMLLNV